MPGGPQFNDLRPTLAAWPHLLADVENRLAETLSRIAALTPAEVATYPAAPRGAWPKLDHVSRDPNRRPAIRAAFWAVVLAAEGRVAEVAPEAGWTSEAYCWPVWQIGDDGWLTVIGCAGSYVVEPLSSPVSKLLRRTQIRRWRATLLETWPG